MAIIRDILENLEALATWMQQNYVPSLFKSVTYSSGVMTATDADDNTVLEIHQGTGSVNQGYLRAYRAENNYIGITLTAFPTTTSGMGGMSVIGCDNGFVINCNVRVGYNDAGFAVLFAKTNKEKTAIIFPSTAQATPQKFYTGLHHVAFGDSETIATTTTFTPESAQQNCLVPFATNANIGDTSYTPYAYYIAMGTNYAMGFGKFEMGDSVYISNGYWAIREGS